MDSPPEHLLENEGTRRTKGTTAELHSVERFPTKRPGENLGNLTQFDGAKSALPAEPIPVIVSRPGFCTHDEAFSCNGVELPAGLYWHGLQGAERERSAEVNPKCIDEWICSPIHAIASTANERGAAFGLLLRFVNSYGEWQEWAAPMHMLKGSGEELRGELLNMGVRISPRHRGKLMEWMMGCYPELRIVAALQTGWYGESFVLPHRTIGADNIRFQSAHAAHNDFELFGMLDGWQKNVAALCVGNPLLVLAVSAAFSGPLMSRAKLQKTGGAGIHLVGDSSQGKSTALQSAASVWGAPGFVRTWRATSNGLEATAAALNDTLLVLDEISECDSREIGTIIYALANGSGKQRASRTGGARESARWRIFLISSGERTVSAHMAEAGKQAKAGQEARLLDIHSTGRAYGLFDELHGHADGRVFADQLKQATSNHYGLAGPAFLKCLIDDKSDLPAIYAKACALPGFNGRDGVENRSAGIFALIGIAGELASSYGITGWVEGEAMKAALLGYDLWRDFRGKGQTEDRQILSAVSEFILRHGDARFSSINDEYDVAVRDRAGYWRGSIEGRIYLFNSPALKEACKGYDIRRILAALDSAGWIVEHDIGRRSKKVKVAGTALSFYAIRPIDGGES